MLRGENLLFSSGDDREAYIEFAAFHLELTHFDPDHVDKFFPTIRDSKAIEETLALDVGVLGAARGMQAGRAAELAPAAKIKPPSMAPRSGPRGSPLTKRSRPGGERCEAEGQRRPLDAGADARRRGRSGRRRRARAARLRAALPEPPDEPIRPSHPTPPVGRSVARRDPALAEAAARSDSPRALEARVLHDLQKTCVDAERRRNAVDAVTWMTSLFRRPIVRPSAHGRVVRVARHLRHAFDGAHRAALSKADREKLEHVFRAAIACADGQRTRAIKPDARGRARRGRARPAERAGARRPREALRGAPRPRHRARLARPLAAPRRALAQQPQDRRISRPPELVLGDPILRADALLVTRLDGVYRRGEIYLRFLQKVSSVAFGTRVGRLVTLHLALPLLLSFVLLEGLQHLAHPIGKALGHPHVAPAQCAVVRRRSRSSSSDSSTARRFASGLRAALRVASASFFMPCLVGIPASFFRRPPCG